MSLSFKRKQESVVDFRSPAVTATGMLPSNMAVRRQKEKSSTQVKIIPEAVDEHSPET